MACPVCGSPVQPTDLSCKTCGAPLNPNPQFPAGTTLHGGRYRVNRVLGQGGFGITYDAQDTQLGIHVAVKELFIDGSTRRGRDVLPPGSYTAAEYQESKRRFVEEAKVLYRFNDPGIVQVLNYFEENNTAYLVMEFLEGATLGSAIEKRGPMPPEVVMEVARSITRPLALVHNAGLLHRDIKPDNIFLDKQGRVILIDFGSVRTFQAGQTVSHTRLVTPGYAPLEQYSSAAKFGPYTDIYSLGATLLHALTGVMPPPATDLMMGTKLPAMPASTPPVLREAITRAMSLKIEDRPQSADDLLRLLGGAPAPAPMPPKPAEPRPGPTPSNPTRVAANQSQPARPAPPRPQPVPTPQPAPTHSRTPAPVPPTAAPVRQPPAPPPQPVPTPRPVPAPHVPAPPKRQPAPQQPAAAGKARAPITRAVLLLFFLGFGALFAVSAYQSGLMGQLPQGDQTFMLGAGAVGAVLGLFLGMLVWAAMPILLPPVAALAAAYLANGYGLHWPTVGSLAIMAATLSIIFMRLIQRISF
ncbi:serine/threonine protein kinase [Deinococcus cavernae]|uniref:Serine/threonine protein kinase n=1 Tax=Deinococcus cavernae TaxID=2320857 RepID=A0A418VC25_9DEIO|nr:serine/threonine protein kinase [Deinococcus cavernae]